MTKSKLYERLIWMLITTHQVDLFTSLEQVGLLTALKNYGSVLIKINLARPPEKNHPRTDATILARVVEYILAHGARCAIAEGANGFLETNLQQVGLGWLLNEAMVKVIDLDYEEVVDRILVDGEEHFYPRCLREYQVRIGIPCASRRNGAVFSNNIKLFVGAVPRRYYQDGSDSIHPRPRIHHNLHESIVNVYKGIMEYAPFHFFINGGVAFDELCGEFDFGQIVIGTDALELDHFVLRQFFHQNPPEYMLNLGNPCDHRK